MNCNHSLLHTVLFSKQNPGFVYYRLYSFIWTSFIFSKIYTIYKYMKAILLQNGYTNINKLCEEFICGVLMILKSVTG